MKYFVKIDSKSVKENPDWPQPAPVFLGGTITAEAKHHYSTSAQEPQEFEDFRLISSQSHSFVSDCVYVGVLKKGQEQSDLKKLFKKHGLDLGSYKIDYNYQEIRTLSPQPRYLYEYIPTQVRCNKCRKTFLHTELKSEYIETGVDEDGEDSGYFERNKCPNCKKVDCCVVQFEKPKSEYPGI